MDRHLPPLQKETGLYKASYIQAKEIDYHRIKFCSNLVINEKQTFIYDARPVPLSEDTGKDYAVLSVHEDKAEIESESDAWSEDSNSDSDENIPLSALVK
ncbi:unnamed protein product [Acanthoscelides obtectus]|uniref:Uncharacterized protein n=1 Tax=Acanthoscelides obtectus TaxID=200917 RepID=A0A9P0LR98_ACAOB|nr:unnamed protein product [Acanthoscelides obtectus]CAK1638181.1 hypothetical protein AOBTE_LOCUS10434 [Acanthoscelides obtectus]